MFEPELERRDQQFTFPSNNMICAFPQACLLVTAAICLRTLVRGNLNVTERSLESKDSWAQGWPLASPCSWGDHMHLSMGVQEVTQGESLSRAQHTEPLLCWPMTTICNYRAALIIGREKTCCNV